MNTSELTSKNHQLIKILAQDRVDWALRKFGHQIVMSSSFGAQSAVLLHMVTQQRPAIPVILIDTGYLFPETYRFIDELTARFDLNLKIYRPALSPGWLEARHGKLWESGLVGIEIYNQICKVEPMKRALEDLGAKAWISGIRRNQDQSRAHRQVLEAQNGLIKVHPLIDWTDRDVHRYLTRHELPYHPLWDKGYVSIGDVHTTRSLKDSGGAEGTRFFGIKRECGLHEAWA